MKENTLFKIIIIQWLILNWQFNAYCDFCMTELTFKRVFFILFIRTNVYIHPFFQLLDKQPYLVQQ